MDLEKLLANTTKVKRISDTMLIKSVQLQNGVSREAAAGFVGTIIRGFVRAASTVASAIATLIASALDSKDLRSALKSDRASDIISKIIDDLDNEEHTITRFAYGVANLQYLRLLAPIPLIDITLKPFEGIFDPMSKNPMLPNGLSSITPDKTMKEFNRIMIIRSLHMLSKAATARTIEFMKTQNSVRLSSGIDITQVASSDGLCNVANAMIDGLTKTRLFMDYVEAILAKINADRSASPWTREQELDVISAFEAARNAMSYVKRTIGPDNPYINTSAYAWLYIYASWPNNVTGDPSFQENYWWFNSTRKSVSDTPPSIDSEKMEKLIEGAELFFDKYNHIASCGLCYDALSSGNLKDAMKKASEISALSATAIAWSMTGNAWGLLMMAAASPSSHLMAPFWNILSTSLTSAPYFDRESFNDMINNGHTTNKALTTIITCILPRMIGAFAATFAEAAKNIHASYCVSHAAHLLKAAAETSNQIMGIICQLFPDKDILSAVEYAKSSNIVFTPFIEHIFAGTSEISESAIKIIKNDPRTYLSINNNPSNPNYVCDVMEELVLLDSNLTKNKLIPILHKPDYERFNNA